MKKKIIVVCVCLIFCMNGCKNNVQVSYASDELNAPKYSEATNLSNDKTTTGYITAFSEKTEITIENTEALLLQKIPEIISTMPELSLYLENFVYLSETSRVILAAAGDLNGDQKGDLAVVVEFMEDEKESPGYAKGELSFASRHIYILIQNADGSYAVTNKNEDLILEYNEGGTFGDPLESVSIENGFLSIEHYGGSSSRWGYTMRFSFNEGRLVLADMTSLSHSTFTAGGEETICDFTNHTVTRYTLAYSDKPPLLLFSGELPAKTYLFDNAAFREIEAFSSIPFLPYLDQYQFDRFDGPLDLNISASQALDMVMAEHYPDFEKVRLPWTQECRDNYSALLFYEVPDCYYKGISGTLEYFMLDVYENDGEITDIEHTIIFEPSDNGEVEFYTIKDK